MTDSHDLFVLDALLRAGYRPRVITTEYNSNYPPGLAITQVDPTLEPRGAEGYQFAFRECAWGASATALRRVAEENGYTFVGRVDRLDLVWVRNDLVGEDWVVPDFEWFFDEAVLGQLHQAAQTSDDIFDHLMDYDVYRSTGDVGAAKSAAKAVLAKANLPCFEGIRMRPAS